MIKVVNEDNLLDESISFEDIQNARYSSSFMNDRAWLTIDGLAYAKIGKNKWESQPTGEHELGSTYSDAQIYNKVKNSKECNLNESVGLTYSDWLDRNQGPEAGDELVTAWIDNFESAAEILKCSVNDLVNITEDDDEVAYDKIIKKIAKGDKGKSVELPMIDGKAGLFTLTDGTTVITTNEWGYGTVFVRKSDLKKAMNESVRVSESAKISKMTEIDGLAFSGLWQLPSGVPGLVAGVEDLELVIVGNEEGIDLLLQNKDGEGWFKFYSADKEKEAVAEFKEVAALMTDLVDTSKLAKKFGLKGSRDLGRMRESYSDRGKSVIYDLWFENLEEVMGYSKQIADNLRKSKYGYEAYTDKTYDTWKSLLVKAGVKIPSIVNESASGRGRSENQSDSINEALELLRGDRDELLSLLVKLRTEASEALYAAQELKNYGECWSILTYLVQDSKTTADYLKRLIDNGRKQESVRIDESVGYDVSGTAPTGAGDYNIDEERGISDPAKAIELWFKIGAKHPLNTDISAYKKADAVALITWAHENQDKITEWHKKYGCPYKLESMIAAVERQFNNGCKSFHENEYGEMIDPFCIG